MTKIYVALTLTFAYRHFISNMQYLIHKLKTASYRSPGQTAYITYFKHVADDDENISEFVCNITCAYIGYLDCLNVLFNILLCIIEKTN